MARRSSKPLFDTPQKTHHWLQTLIDSELQFIAAACPRSEGGEVQVPDDFKALLKFLQRLDFESHLFLTAPRGDTHGLLVEDMVTRAAAAVPFVTRVYKDFLKGKCAPQEQLARLQASFPDMDADRIQRLVVHKRTEIQQDSAKVGKPGERGKTSSLGPTATAYQRLAQIMCEGMSERWLRDRIALRRKEQRRRLAASIARTET